MSYAGILHPAASLTFTSTTSTLGRKFKAVNKKKKKKSFTDASLGEIVADPAQKRNLEQLIFCSSVLQCMEEAQFNHRSIHHRTEYNYYYQIYNNSICKDMKFYLPDSPIWAFGSLCRLFIGAAVCPSTFFPWVLS